MSGQARRIAAVSIPPCAGDGLGAGSGAAGGVDAARCVDAAGAGWDRGGSGAEAALPRSAATGRPPSPLPGPRLSSAWPPLGAASAVASGDPGDGDGEAAG